MLYALFLGLAATVTQVVLLREFFVIFYGNEIAFGLFLAVWLIFTGTGSLIAGRFFRKAAGAFPALPVYNFIALSLFLPLSLFLIRDIRPLFALLPGEILSPQLMILSALTGLLLICLTLGALFSVLSGHLLVMTRQDAMGATSRVYLWESAGAGIGGLMLALFLIEHFSPSQILGGLAFLSSLAAFVLSRSRWHRTAAGALSVLMAVALIGYAGRFEKVTLKRMWRGFHIKRIVNSPYGNLALMHTQYADIFFENGLKVFAKPDVAQAEEAVHFALLQHPSPKRVLLMGGAFGDAILQALKHPSIRHLDVVELDPAVPSLFAQQYPKEWQEIRQNPRIHYHTADARFFLLKQRQPYDVIILNLPGPYTTQLNRFYSREFYALVRNRLRQGGVFSFQLPGYANYLNPEQAAFFRTVYATLSTAFPSLTAFPGETVHFFASNQTRLLTDSADTLVARLRRRKITTQYVREYYLPFRLMPDRMRELKEKIAPASTTAINLDFVPKAYFFDFVLWNQQFGFNFGKFLKAAQALPFGILLLFWLGIVTLIAYFLRRKRHLAGLALLQISATGATMIGLEILLLIAFQVIYGTVYFQLAILIAMFMLGMGYGSAMAHGAPRRKPQKIPQRLALINVTLLVSAAAFVLLAPQISRKASLFWRTVLADMLFPVIAAFYGFLGGFQFTLASGLYFENDAKNIGKIYGFDLFGSSGGALLVSAFLLPLYGFTATAAFLLAPLGILGIFLTAKKN